MSKYETWGSDALRIEARNTKNDIDPELVQEIVERFGKMEQGIKSTGIINNKIRKSIWGADSG